MKVLILGILITVALMPEDCVNQSVSMYGRLHRVSAKWSPVFDPESAVPSGKDNTGAMPVKIYVCRHWNGDLATVGSYDPAKRCCSYVSILGVRCVSLNVEFLLNPSAPQKLQWIDGRNGRFDLEGHYGAVIGGAAGLTYADQFICRLSYKNLFGKKSQLQGTLTAGSSSCLASGNELAFPVTNFQYQVLVMREQA